MTTPREHKPQTPTSSVAAVSSRKALTRVSPEALRATLRRRGVLDLFVFATAFAAAFGLSSLTDPAAVAWRTLIYVVMLFLPVVVLLRLPAQRCPACGTTLEHIAHIDDEGREMSATSCPRCQVEID